jgi:putative transposase
MRRRECDRADLAKQIRKAIQQLEAGRKAEGVGRELGVSKHTLYGWRAKYGGLEKDDLKRVKELEDENRRLKHLVADLSLDREALKWVIEKNGWSSQLGAKR